MTQTPLRIAINGFGRIGRLCLRAILEQEAKTGHQSFEVLAINDLSPPSTVAHLLEFDSVHGHFDGEVTLQDKSLFIKQGPLRKTIPIFQERDPKLLPWHDLGVDMVFECSGVFTSKETASYHLEAGAKKVLISAPGKNVDLTVVYGVNHHEITKDHTVISNASCTTNCLAPLAKILDDACGIERGFMTTIHGYTGDQNLIDTHHNDLHRSRAAALSMIPTSTGAARAVGLVLPHLNGKIDGTAIRIPTPNVSAVDFTFTTKRTTSIDDINAAFKKAASEDFKSVVSLNEKPLVSIDFNHDPASCTFNLKETQVIDGVFVRVLAWYDNEWGFSNRMLDTAKIMGAFYS